MKPPPPSALDLIAVGFVLFNAQLGFKRAVPGELVKLIALIPAVLTFVFSFGPINHMIARATALNISAESRPMVGLISTLLAALIVLSILRRIISSFLPPHSPRQKAAGANMIAATVYAIAFVLLTWTTMGLWPVPELKERFTDKSLIGRCLAPALPALHNLMSASSSVAPAPATEAPAKPSVLNSLRDGKRAIREISK